MLIPAPIPLPAAWERRYLVLRILMYLAIGTFAFFFALRALFPIITQGFNFRAPGSSKNNIVLPRSPDNIARANGKLEKNGTLIADTAVAGDFSLVTATAVLEKKSAVPTSLSLTLRRSYQSFFYPTDGSVSDFPQEITYRIGDTYYALRNGILFPFVSEAAYLSRFPKEHSPMFDTLASLPERFPISETWLGFRVGSLLSNATGVFIVTSETEIRPIGSADVFLGLGYNFADVIEASEEELGVYARGRIVLLGTAHPDGTLLFDQDTQSYYLVNQGTKQLMLSGAYRDFLLQNQHPILVSSEASKQTAHCALVPDFFGSTFSCTAAITALAPGFGNDFELQLQSLETDIDLNTLALSFETAKNKTNLLTFLSQIKQRLLDRFAP